VDGRDSVSARNDAIRALRSELRDLELRDREMQRELKRVRSALELLQPNGQLTVRASGSDRRKPAPASQRRAELLAYLEQVGGSALQVDACSAMDLASSTVASAAKYLEEEGKLRREETVTMNGRPTNRLVLTTPQRSTVVKPGEGVRAGRLQ
jgi:hypothetical protein